MGVDCKVNTPREKIFVKVCDRCGTTWSDVRGECPACYEIYSNVKVFRPTQDEIRAACERIRSTWSEEEENRRRAAAYRCQPVEYDQGHSHFSGGGRVNRKDINSYLD